MRTTVAAIVVLFAVALPAAPPTSKYPPPEEVRAAFLKQLDRPRVPPDPQEVSPPTEEDGLVTENLTIASERKPSGPLERVPILIVRPSSSTERLPAVIVLHGTGGNKEAMKPMLEKLAERGIIGVAIDARYHGARSGGKPKSEAYVAAITKAWEAKPGEFQEHPFFYDTCWDLWRLLDYLEQRDDVDPKRIGMIGFSMGGIQTWLAASVDKRVAVAVPAISVQSLAWGLENDHWHARAKTIAGAHQAAARDMGESEVNARVCKALWNKIIPGMLDRYDGPSMIRLFAPRPLLVLSGELDPNCPLEGAQLAFDEAERVYQDADATDNLKIDVAPGVAHKVTDEQREMALDWFERWFAPVAVAN
jgi:dienelactone hydrolase